MTIDIIKVHPDPTTVPCATRHLFDFYKSMGFNVDNLLVCMFDIILEGGVVHIYWEDGKFYQQIA